MAQSVNRFGLDEVNTQLTAPTSNVQVQGPLDTSLTTNTRSRGIQNFAASLQGLAQKDLANQIHNDTVDAQLASAYDREQPEGLEPEAVFAFNKAEDLKLALTVQQNLDNYAIVEGSQILNDSRLTRKQKLSQYQLGMQAIINTGKQGITPVNANEIFPAFERDYNRLNNVAATELAKQKKEEESSTNAVAIESMIDNIWKDTTGPIIDTLSGKNTIAEDDDLTPQNIAKLTVQMGQHMASKGLSVKNFNGIVNHITKTKRGADNREIKATVLTSVVSRMLRAAEEGDVTVDPQIITNLVDSLKGNPRVKGSTLRSEINGGTEYGKIFKTIEDGFTGNLKTLLDNKRTTATRAQAERDNQIGTTVFDAPEGTYTEEEGVQILKGIHLISKQNEAIKRWKAGFKDQPQNGLASTQYLAALNSDILKPNGLDVDDSKLTQVGIDYNLSNKAVTSLRAALDPRSKAGAHRTRVLANSTVQLLKNSFKPTVMAHLKMLEAEGILDEFFKDGKSIQTPLVLAKIEAKFGKGSQVYKKAFDILNAELKFSQELESLILNNPNKEPAEIAIMADQRFSLLFSDVVNGLNPGATEARIQEEQAKNKKSLLEKRFERAGKLLRGEADETSGAVTQQLTPTQEKAKAAEEKKIAIAKVLKDVKDPDTMAKYIALAAKEFEQEAAIVDANHKINGTKPATRSERISLIIKGTGTGISGIPTGRDRDVRVSERAVAAVATNPDTALILRAKALQTAEQQERIELSKNLFTFRTEKQMLENEAAGKELLRIGNFQLTTDDLANLTLDNTLELPGNVGFYIDRFRVLSGVRPNSPAPKATEGSPKVEEPKEKLSAIQKAAKGINTVLEAGAKDAGASSTSQDPDFDPNQAGPRGFTGPASKPLASKPKSASGNKVLETLEKVEISPFEKALATEELGDSDAKALKGKPYISSRLAGQLNLKGSDRTITSVEDVPHNSDRNIATKGKTGITLGFGHDVTPNELSSGTIHGVPFVDANGKFIELDETALLTIFKKDVEKQRRGAEKEFNAKGHSIPFTSLPKELQDFLTDRHFNTGTKASDKADTALNKILALSDKRASGISVSQDKINKQIRIYIKEISERSQVQDRANRMLEASKATTALFKFFNIYR